METINKNLDTPQVEESKQNLSQSNLGSPLSLKDVSQKAKSPTKITELEETITLGSGKLFNKQRYDQIKISLGLTGTLRLPSDIIDDGKYDYFWASTQYDGQIEKKKTLGYEVCTNKNKKEYRQYAGMEGSIRHEHVLMRISREDRDLISEIQREKKAYAEMERITDNLDPEGVFENKSRLKRDGEVTLAEGLQNKYNRNPIKKI